MSDWRVTTAPVPAGVDYRKTPTMWAVYFRDVLVLDQVAASWIARDVVAALERGQRPAGLPDEEWAEIREKIAAL